MNKRIPFSVLIVSVIIQSLASAQTFPSTQPTLDYYSGQVQKHDYPLGPVLQAKVILAPGIAVPITDIQGLMDWLSWSPQSSTPFELILVPDIKSHTADLLYFLVCIDQPPDSYAFKSLKPNADELTAQTFQQLRALVRSDPPMSAEQRYQRLAELKSNIAAFSQKMDALAQLAKAQPNPTAEIANKLHALRDREQDIQMKLSAQQARRGALEQGLDQLKKQVQEQRRDDPKIDYLRAQIDLKLKALDRMKNARDAFTNAQTDQAAADVMEAKAALAAAEADAAKGGRGELMDRLTNELSMVAIDTADLQIQLSQLQAEIAKYDPARLSLQQLDALVNQTGLGSQNSPPLPPLYYQLQKQQNDLRREELILLVDDIVIIPEPQANPGPTTR